MNGPALACALLLALATVLSWVRLLHWQRRREAGQPPRYARLAVLLLAQPLAAGLLYLALFPPPVATEGGRLTVLTAGADTTAAAATGETRIALPEAPAGGDAERVPDLATALRRHPGTQALQVLGGGLEARDRDAARGLPLDFAAPPEPVGLVELDAPLHVGRGDAFAVRGRVHGIEGARVELLDAAGQVLDRQPPGEDGRFRLGGTARVAGLADYTLRVLDASGRPHERLPLPLQVTEPAPLRVLLLAGAPNPELKYLRRWAVDAGVDLQSRIAAGAGVDLGDGPVAMDTATLGGFDLVVLDERAWSSLSSAQRRGLDEAVAAGLGLLLRATGPLPADLQRQLQAWGLHASTGNTVVEAMLDEGFGAGEDERAATLHARIGPGTADAPRDADAPAIALPALQRRDLRIDGAAVLPLARDSKGQALAAWTAHGRGRVGVVGLADSYRLVLSGRADRHGEFWSYAFATVARATHATRVAPMSPARQGERLVLCGLGEGAPLLPPDGDGVPLVIDPAVPGACAAAWPRHAGWHWLRQGDDPPMPLHVSAADEGLALQAAQRRDATLRLAAQAPSAAPATAGQPRRGPSWPWLLGWLLLASALWWFERRTRAQGAAQ
jgi:hypothetical protein